eukprot:6173725-Pleurochrysis_carterae.AAC.1
MFITLASALLSKSSTRLYKLLPMCFAKSEYDRTKSEHQQAPRSFESSAIHQPCRPHGTRQLARDGTRHQHLQEQPPCGITRSSIVVFCITDSARAPGVAFEAVCAGHGAQTLERAAARPDVRPSQQSDLLGLRMQN